MKVTAPSDSRRAVLDAAARIAYEDGAESISIKALTEVSGISNGSIYHHFHSRDGVIAALVLEVLGTYQGGVIEVLESAKDAESGIGDLVRHHLDWIEANPAMARLLMSERDRVATGPWSEELGEQNREFFGAVGAWLAGQVAEGEIPEVAVNLVHALIVAPAQEVCNLWLSGRIQEPPTSFAERLAPAAWAALNAVPSREKEEK